jgi:phosphate starvation-inducible PhoH-like protein
MSTTSSFSIQPETALSLFGPHDQNLRRIRERFGVAVTHRDGEVRVTGESDSVADASEVLSRMRKIIERRGEISGEDINTVFAQVTGDEEPPFQSSEIIQVGRKIKPKTPGQHAYLEAIRSNELVFAIGPAGTGKTFLAVAAAIEALKQNQIRKIVLVRPAVEAGESLGYLPGDLQAKINPYLRPLLDAIQEMVDYDQFQKLLERDVIEVVPLAYMRGRTLNDAFIICDEAQNTSISQMKMFLTRMGLNSKIVVSGDTTQIDLPSTVRSGLIDALHRLKNIKGIGFVKLTRGDIVRHRLVQNIVDAYEQRDGRQADSPRKEKESS